MSYPNHREHAIALINEGGATRASLCETLGIKPTSLATVFSQLRLMGKCPIEDDNKVLRIGTPEEYEALKTVKTSNKKVLTPEEQLDAANKRVDRATKAYDRAAENKNQDKSAKTKWKFKAAEAELELAKIALAELTGSGAHADGTDGTFA